MRITGLKVKETFDALIDAAVAGENSIMDEHVEISKRLCPVRKGETVGNQYRKEYGDKNGRVLRDVLFTPKTGRGKGKVVNFIASTWTGRIAGSLKDTIRKVEKHDRKGNVRVYAGNNKIFYARFTEYGTSSTGWGKGVPKQPFLRPGFQAIKPKVKSRIEEYMRTVPEVK